MPFIYSLPTKDQAENFTTSGTANTEIDYQFVAPGSSRPVSIIRILAQGKAAGATALSGISIRLKQWTSTKSSGGSSATPAPKNKLNPACVATAGLGTSGGTAAVTSGTGGPAIVGYTGMGVSGQGGVVALNPDDVSELDGNANMSMDLFSSSPTISLNFETETTIQEG
jgi:hypothetical protein